jgi:8-oxo-dGTP diphosphatase
MSVAFCSSCGAGLSTPPPVQCAACGAQHWRNPKPCANALVVHDGRVLLAQRARAPWQGLWAVPGGFVEAGEHPIETAEREVLEELGLPVQVTAYLGTWVERYADDPDGGDEIINVAYYLAKLVGPAAVTVDPDEVADAGWFGLNAVPAASGPPGTFAAVIVAARAVLAESPTVHDRPIRASGSREVDRGARTGRPR